MNCSHCKHSGSARWRRIDHPIKQNYLICPKCGRASRKPSLPMRGAKARHLVLAARDLQERARVAAEQIKLKILVWGPSTASEKPTKKKRLEISEALQSSGHEALLSEDLITDASTPVNLQEMIQLTSVGLIVLVADSPGSLGEFHDVGLLVGKRLLTWLPDTARGGYAGGMAQMMLTAGNEPLYFQPEDVSSCVMTLASVDWVDAWRASKVLFEEQDRLRRKNDPSEPISQ